MTHVLIVSANFYPELSAELVAGATQHLYDNGVTHELVTVPGAFEIPGVIAQAMGNRKYQGFVALGCVIRGETTHYDYVCAESARGLMDLSLKGVAIGYGILTVETEEQAQARADRKQGNKGRDAVDACLRMIAIKRQFGTTA